MSSARLPVLSCAEAAAAEAAFIDGEYSLGGLPIRVWEQGGKLMAQARGQGAFELLHDSHGDFYPSTFSALLTPQNHLMLAVEQAMLRGPEWARAARQGTRCDDGQGHG